MKKITILLVFLVIAPGLVWSQKIRDFMILTDNSIAYNKSVVNMTDYTGEPFLNKEFVIGTTMTPDSTIYQNVPLRYNIYNGVFEFEKDDTPYVLEPAKYGTRIDLDGKVFVYTDYYYTNSEKGYLEQLVDGKFSLYKKYKVRYHRPEPAGAYSDAKPSNFETLPPEYFLGSKESGRIDFITKDKELIELCGAYSQQAGDYIKKNKLKIRKEKDLIELVNYLNTL